MDRLVGRLLSELHAAVPVSVCPGEWAWTTTIAGGLVALLPMLGAIFAALTRHWTGNRYGLSEVSWFVAVGLVMTGLLPWLVFSGSSAVFRGALDGRAVGLSGGDVASLGTTVCLGNVQADYLGGSRTVWDVLDGVTGGRPAEAIGALGLLVVLPLLCLVFVFAQARLAFRRGPKWPARLLWLPMLPLLAGTAGLSATVVAHLWLGFLPAAVLGLLGVAVVGAPRWSVIDRQAARDAPPALPAPQPSAAQPSAAQPSAPQPQPLGHGAMAASPNGGPRPVPTRIAQPPHRPQAPPAPPHRPPTAPLGPLTPPRPYSQPMRALATDPGPLPETLQRKLGLAGAGVGPAAGPAGGQPEPPTLPASRFRRIRPLGSGGFGTVWLAKDTALDRTVAVKAAKVPDAETERRIRREARALAAVHHPNCVRIYDILTDTDGELAIIMEYVPGRPLSAEIEAAGRLSDLAAARLWSTLAGALHAAHGTGVLHRDVKPSNVIIDETGFPHLIDFGIARSTGDVTLTATGMVLGTPDYMPPEVAAGKPASPAADAWQLAATVSYALAGTPPRGHRDGAVAAMLAAAQGEPCNQLPAGTPHRALLERALHPDPARRPSLPAVQAELDRWLSGIGQQVEGPVTQRLAPPPARPQGPQRPQGPPVAPPPGVAEVTIVTPALPVGPPHGSASSAADTAPQAVPRPAAAPDEPGSAEPAPTRSLFEPLPSKPVPTSPVPSGSGPSGSGPSGSGPSGSGPSGSGPSGSAPVPPPDVPRDEPAAARSLFEPVNAGPVPEPPTTVQRRHPVQPPGPAATSAEPAPVERRPEPVDGPATPPEPIEPEPIEPESGEPPPRPAAERSMPLLPAESRSEPEVLPVGSKVSQIDPNIEPAAERTVASMATPALPVESRPAAVEPERAAVEPEPVAAAEPEPEPAGAEDPPSAPVDPPSAEALSEPAPAESRSTAKASPESTDGETPEREVPRTTPAQPAVKAGRTPAPQWPTEEVP